MNDFFNFLPSEEHQRISNLEPFDEYEEWHLKCSHYVILCALNGSCQSLSSQLLPFKTASYIPIHPFYVPCKIDNVKRRPPSSIIKRFVVQNPAHAM